MEDKSVSQTETLSKIKSPYLILNITQVQQNNDEGRNPAGPGGGAPGGRQTPPRSGGPH